MSEFDDDLNPMLDPRVEKGYTQEYINNLETEEDVTNEPIPEAKYIKPPITDKAKEIPFEKEERNPITPEYSHMSASEKRNNAEKSADALLHAYVTHVPIPFIKIASYNMRKMEVLNKKGEIDLKMVVKPDGTTVEKSMLIFNNVVEQKFDTTPESQEAIREPLVEVLMEQGMVLTPAQRLAMAVGADILQKTIACFQLVAARKDEIEMHREYMQEKLKIMRERKHDPYYTNQQSENIPPIEKEEPIQTETRPKETTTDVEEEYEFVPPIINEEKTEKEYSIEDYINSQEDNSDENDESITIEEVPLED